MVASRAMPETATGALTADARAALLAWYDARGRSLAFRRSRDPYAILVPRSWRSRRRSRG
jgi:adenine-specific DNA glycosylase